MRLASRAVAITETDKVLLINALQNPKHRLLDYFVLQGSDGGCILHLLQLALGSENEKTLRLLGFEACRLGDALC